MRVRYLASVSLSFASTFLRSVMSRETVMISSTSPVSGSRTVRLVVSNQV